MLVISTWFWGDKYPIEDVEKLKSSVARNLKERHEFLCFSDRHFTMPGVEVYSIEDLELTKIPGCFARMRMFDPAWQDKYIWPDGVRSENDRLVNLDLDTVVTGQLDPLFPGSVPFMILRGANSTNPCPYCGALMLLRPGVHPELWADFSLEEANKAPKLEFADDQGWIWYKLGDKAAGWKAGTQGVYAFQKPGWPPGESLPADARLVTFNGWRSPATFSNLPWVRKHWR